MITLLTVLFVLISLALVITVPVALATPGEWESSKENFNNIHSIETSNYIPKPSVEAYYSLIRKENIISKKSIMFEDTVWNLKTAKDLGMTTVLISPKNHLLENNKSDYIDYNITDLVKFLK